MPYAIYLRKSRADIEAEQRGEGETLSRHAITLEELAKKQKLPVVKVYKEIVSGENIAARPQMQQLLADVNDGKYDGVLVMEIERLARGDTIDQGIVAQAFRDSETKIITPIKTYDPNNEFDEEYFEFSLFMSRREYKTIKRRMNAGRLAAVKEGNYIGTNPPYGYKKISPEPKVHTLEIVESEAEIIRLIFHLYLHGKGIKAITGELDRLGVPPRKNKCWEVPSIKKILENPIYIGKIRWQCKASGDTLYEGKHEPIISEEIFNAAQDKRKNNPAAQVPESFELRNYYHNLLYCNSCGRQMRRRYVSETGKAHMLCVRRECRGKVVSATMDSIDMAVLSAVRYRLEQLLNSSTDAEPQADEPDRRKPLQAELDKLNKQQERLYDLLEQGVYDAAVFLERSAIIKEKAATIDAALKELQVEEKKLAAKLTAEQSVAALQRLLDNFADADEQQRAELLQGAIQKIVYSKTTKACCNKLDTDMNLDVIFL